MGERAAVRYMVRERLCEKVVSEQGPKQNEKRIPKRGPPPVQRPWGKSVPRVGSEQQGGQRGQVIREREQGSLDQASSCGGQAKQLDSRYILKAELIQGWTQGLSKKRSHEDSQILVQVSIY